MTTSRVRVVALVAVALAIAAAAFVSLQGRDPRRADAASATDGSDDDSLGANARRGAFDGAGNASAHGSAFTDAGVLRETVHDARVREEMRRKIFEAWASDDTAEKEARAASPAHVPMPELSDGGVDPAYVRERVREDFFPMARECYGAFLDQRHDAGRTDVNGSIVMKFTIVGDEKVGGVVEEASLGDAGTLTDETLATCFRESMMSMAFRPPPRRGQVTVEYPIAFADDDDDAAPTPSSR